MLACVMQSRNEVLMRLHHLAMHDPLTGILNRKAFRDDAETRLAHAKKPCGLLIFDLDHFKRVNDTYGHAAGDKRSWSPLRSGHSLIFAPTACSGGLAGREFAAMVFDCSETDVTALAERLRIATREPIELDDGKTLSVSTSIGITIIYPTEESVSIDAAFQRADTMLYRAKAAGRDRAEISMLIATQN
jgi:diguanylate cyclase (GGDEF)-like protein